ncbi:MAG: acetyl/acyl transferase [Phycisphaerales bacterium]
MTQVTLEQGAWHHEAVVFEGTAHIGYQSCVGHGQVDEEGTRIGDGVRIGAFCIIENGAHIGPGVEIDHYCRIGGGVRIGANSRILYGAQVFDEVVIGQNCIVAGDLVDRAVIEDEVTFQGNTAHTHADPNGDWDKTEEPSPKVLRGSVVGIGAILIGGVTVGPRSYVAAGEIVRTDVAPEMVLMRGQLKPLSSYKGIIKVRGT